jgi:hypothetical protein
VWFSIQIHTTWSYRAGGGALAPHGRPAGSDVVVGVLPVVDVAAVVGDADTAGDGAVEEEGAAAFRDPAGMTEGDEPEQAAITRPAPARTAAIRARTRSQARDRVSRGGGRAKPGPRISGGGRPSTRDLWPCR